jgi:hypothetical protein
MDEISVILLLFIWRGEGINYMPGVTKFLNTSLHRNPLIDKYVIKKPIQIEANDE